MDQDAFEIFPGKILPYSQGVLKEKTLHPDNHYFLFSFAQGTVSLELLVLMHIAPTQKWSTYLTNKHVCGTKLGSVILPSEVRNDCKRLKIEIHFEY